MKHTHKRQAQQIHAARRFMQRFGIAFTRRHNAEVVKMIQQHRGTFVKRQGNRISLWDVQLNGRIVRVAYDKIRKVIVTVLPPGECRKEV